MLPEGHSARVRLLAQFKKHVAGIVAQQHGTCFWHQLLDRNDSYLETSATAIYAYCIAGGINAGWLDIKAYGPMVLQAWNAVHSKINSQGKVEGTCVSTGMGFDGYGPVMLAEAEIYELIKNNTYVINDSSLQF